MQVLFVYEDPYGLCEPSLHRGLAKPLWALQSPLCPGALQSPSKPFISVGHKE